AIRNRNILAAFHFPVPISIGRVIPISGTTEPRGFLPISRPLVSKTPTKKSTARSPKQKPTLALYLRFGLAQLFLDQPSRVKLRLIGPAWQFAKLPTSHSRSLAIQTRAECTASSIICFLAATSFSAYSEKRNGHLASATLMSCVTLGTNPSCSTKSRFTLAV